MSAWTCGILGPSFNIASACASATHAIGTAFHMIRSGMLDVAVTGGCEAPLTLGFMRSWDALRVVAKDTCRPFSRDRSGLVLGEGAGVLVLENMDRAKARGARILGEIVGFGMSSDAGDITAPDPAGAARAMTRGARGRRHRAPTHIDYVQAHGTGTVLNDRNEAEALRTVLGERAGARPGVVVEVHGRPYAVRIRRAEHGLHARSPCAKALAADHEPHRGRSGTRHRLRPQRRPPAAIRTALTNAFAFGGLNAVLVSPRPAIVSDGGLARLALGNTECDRLAFRPGYVALSGGRTSRPDLGAGTATPSVTLS